MFKAFANCFKIPELRQKILLTLGLLALCRLAAAVPCPGIDADALQRLFDDIQSRSGSGTPGPLQMINLFTGGALQKFAIGALGIMPYITASIIMQLMTPIFPTLERWKREGETGHQKINQWTRYLTLGICLVQGYITATVMERPGAIFNVATAGDVVSNPGLRWRIMTVIILTCGTMILMWLGEQITDRGVGNGASLIITIGIVDGLPTAVMSIINLLKTQGTGNTPFTPIHVLILVALFVAVTAATVALTVAVRKVPIQYARATSTRGAAGSASFFPLRLNYSSVMPIIFAQALLMIPPLVLQYGAQHWRWLARLAPFFTFATNSYMLMYAALLILFAFFWVANQFNPIQIADDLKRGGAYIPGVRPGKPTADYLDWTMTRVTTAGALLLTVLALAPMLINRQMPSVDFMIASFFGGSSLLIVVGVVLDTVRQMESHLVMHGYDAFMQRGRLRGRAGY